MTRGRRWVLFLPFVPILLGVIGLFLCYRQPGFTVQKISSRLSPRAEWECVGPAQEALEPMLNQPYRYLGSGAQCFAFESADGRFVLKFFKMKHLLPDRWADYIPSDRYRGRNRRHEERLNQVFLACKSAYEELREETGLIYIHLNPTEHLRKRLLLIDKQGRESVVELDKTVFLLQHKAEPIYKKIGGMLKGGDLAGARRALDSVTALVRSRGQKGFSDGDTGISRNYGFLGERPIHFDFLRLMRVCDEEEPARIEAKMLDWFARHYPEARL